MGWCAVCVLELSIDPPLDFKRSLPQNHCTYFKLCHWSTCGKNVPINWHLLRKHMNVSWWFTMIYHVQPKEVLVGPTRKRNLANRASLRLLIETCTVLRSWTTMILMGTIVHMPPNGTREIIDRKFQIIQVVPRCLPSTVWTSKFELIYDVYLNCIVCI